MAATSPLFGKEDYTFTHQVEVMVKDEVEVVNIFGWEGPGVLYLDGTERPYITQRTNRMNTGNVPYNGALMESKNWFEMMATEKEILISQIARKNKGMRERIEAGNADKLRTFLKAGRLC